MMKKIFVVLLLVIVFNSNQIQAQTEKSEPKQMSKEERFERKSDVMIFPLLKGSFMTGVIPVPEAVNKPNSGQKINLVFDFTQSPVTSNHSTQVNPGLEEVARSLNLHIAAGIKKENLKAVVVFHSSSIFSILNDEYYQKEYNRNNPNITILNQLASVGTELVVCGQSMALRDLDLTNLLTIIKPAISAKTTLTKYQSQNYIMLQIGEK